MDILAVIVIILLLFFIFGGGHPTYGRYAPAFGGANIVWTILVVLLVIWLLRHLF